MGRFKDASAEAEADTGIDMSPLMDCVFILLIFFIVTTTFVEETGVEVDKPQAASASQLEKTSIMIAITDKGAVIYGGNTIGVGGVRNLIKRETQREQIPVILQADKDAPSWLLIKVLDEAKLAGAEKVSVATKMGG